MSRIKARYVAKVVVNWDALRDPGMRSLKEIKHALCDGEVTNLIKDLLSVNIVNCSATIEQLYADVYEVDEDGPV